MRPAAVPWAAVQLLAATAASLALMQQAPPAPAPPAPQPAVPPVATQPARSEALGKPFAGRLRNGVPFPPTGEAFFTWDPILKQSPNRVWRRYATTTTVARVLNVLAE